MAEAAPRSWFPDVCRLPRIAAVLAISELVVVIIALTPSRAGACDRTTLRATRIPPRGAFDIGELLRPVGAAVERSAEVTRTPGYREASRQREGAYGASRNVQRGYDAESGTAHREITRTGPGGRSLERSSDLQRDENGYSRQGSVSGPNGASLGCTPSLSIQTAPRSRRA